MIIRRYHDGSEGFQYQPGDVVRILRTIHGGWFNHCAGQVGTVCDFERVTPGCESVAHFRVKHSPDWGGASCAPWMVQPEDVTYATAEIVEA